MASRIAYLTAGIVILAIILATIVYVAGHRAAKTATTAATPAAPITTTAAGTEAVGKPVKLRVYVYKDFMAWGEDPKIFDKLVENFTRETGIEVEIVRIEGARQMVTQVIAEAKKGVRTADVVVGVDPLLLQELKKAGLVECYLSPKVEESRVAMDAADALDPSHCATPIDYGLIALVYDPSRLNETEKRMLADGITLDELVKLAGRIVGEDPTKSSTGLNFLLYTIAASKSEGRDWRQLWKSLLAAGMMVAPSWGQAYDEFYREGSPHAIVVSYGTDPAYSAWYNMKHGKPAKPDINATVLVVGGRRAGWLQVEGAVIIRGANLEAAKKFVDWLLSREVQEAIPTSQWMIPVMNVKLPDYFKYALTEKDVDTLLNTVLTPGEVYGKLEEWLKEWLSIAGGG
jgi:thiamine transport system substrate-binding protein